MSLVNGRLEGWGQVRLLGPENEPKVAQRILIFHTMGGDLKVVDRMFRTGGFDGTESHFGVGGPRDGTDGVVYQWQIVGYQADAQFAGNDYATSVETADAGNPNNPWTTKQLKSLIRLGVDWCHATGNPARLVKSTRGHGFGYHEQFEIWNTDHHGCPGPVREGQLLTLVIPKVRAELAGEKHHVHVDPHKDDKIAVDGIWSHETIVATQIALGFRGHGVDGIFGPHSRKRLQKRVGVTQDGIIGPITVRAWKHYLKSKGFYPVHNRDITDIWDRGLTAHHQKALNAHKF